MTLPIVLALVCIVPAVAQEVNLSPDALYSRGLARTIAPNVDFAEAARLFRLAADRGLPRAQRSLGELYQYGQGVPKDEAEAVKWYRKAADKGDAKAQSNLGSMYFSGLGGLQKNEKDALKWFKRSAERGDVSGQLSLAGIYMTSDPKEALKLFRAAAEQGSAFAQFSLGSIYEGRLQGIPPNRAEAMAWHTKALQQGYEEARKPLEVLKNMRMIPPDESAANLLTKVNMVVPALAKAARINDYVAFEVVISTAGVIESYKILHGHPLLNDAAIESIKPLRYKPFLINGQPSAVITSITIQYSF